MTENKNVCTVCGSGDGRCGMCGNMCGYSGHNLLRWFLGILIVVWVFSLGMKFGEFKAYVGNDSYGQRHMKYLRMPMMGGTYPTGGVWQGQDVIYSTQVLPPTVSPNR